MWLRKCRAYAGNDGHKGLGEFAKFLLRLKHTENTPSIRGVPGHVVQAAIGSPEPFSFQFVLDLIVLLLR